MSMVPKLVLAAVVTVSLLVVGCGGQSATSSQSSSSHQSAGAHRSTTATVNVKLSKQKPARQYLVKRGQKAEGDYEGPEKPVPGSNPRWSYHLVLSGGQAVPRAPSGSTAAHLTLRGRKVCWRFGALPTTLSNSAAFGRVRKHLLPTAAEIHMGSKGKTGPVVVVFGARYRAAGCIVVRRVVINSIGSAPRFYYLNLVTAPHPKGALRAQL